VGHEIVLTINGAAAVDPERANNLAASESTAGGATARRAWGSTDQAGADRGLSGGRHDEVVSLFTDDATYRDLRVP